VSKFLVGVLTTRDAEKARRCVDSIDCKDVDVVVIVNSPDPEYLKKVEESCAGYTVIETVCNGTPGRGKNSVLDYFIQQRYEYLLPIDGDDYYTKGGIKQLVRYVRMLEPEYMPDVIGQLNNKMTYDGKETEWKDFSKNMSGSTFAAKSRPNWRMLRQMNKLTDEILPFNRFLLLSAHAAKSFRYTEELKAADDYLAMFELYSQTPGINYFLLKEETFYMYDLEEGGTLHAFVSEDNTDNMVSFFEKVKSLDFTKGVVTHIGKLTDD
jgi:glycosyltransferase involved in cell wall biosynthesis